MSSAAMTGRIFNNRYQITERIGIGGMAEVYQAQDNVLGRRVAVKVMLPQYASDAAFAQRRKTIRNSMSSNGFDKEALDEAFASTGIAPNARAETLAPTDFVRLAAALRK